MTAKRMLIDAAHPEEIRVAVMNGNTLEELDVESTTRLQLKGNVYLAKVTRVEPSLQAAFVDYGGNRHGFLAFSEIHPDYYQIPKEDREALLAAEAEAAEEEQRLRDEEEQRGEMPGDEYDADDESSEALAEDLAEDGLEEVDTSDKDDVATIEEGHMENGDDDDDESDDDDAQAAIKPRKITERKRKLNAVVEEYMQKVPPVSAKFGVQALASGGEFEVLDGTWSHSSMVLLGFPSEQVFRDFWYGLEYRPMKELREANSSGDHISFPGVVE